MTYTFEEFHKKLKEEGYEPSPICSNSVGGFRFWVKGIKIDFHNTYKTFTFGGYPILTSGDIEADFHQTGTVMIHLGEAHFAIYTID